MKKINIERREQEIERQLSLFGIDCIVTIEKNIVCVTQNCIVYRFYNDLFIIDKILNTLKQ